MNWLTRLFQKEVPEEPVELAPCRHLHLKARWDDAQDVGKDEQVADYSCMACNETFTREQGQAMERSR